MSSGNLTAILYKTNDIRLEDRPVPDPGDDQVGVIVIQFVFCW